MMILEPQKIESNFEMGVRSLGGHAALERLADTIIRLRFDVLSKLRRRQHVVLGRSER